mmetsp:Transcript_46389/g.110495  ORF Transcript_46389/g.110495 Transcript_46389/m.110495 type:complete len:155 (-) Transcript_46389:26-490(-)
MHAVERVCSAKQTMAHCTASASVPPCSFAMAECKTVCAGSIGDRAWARFAILPRRAAAGPSAMPAEVFACHLAPEPSESVAELAAVSLRKMNGQVLTLEGIDIHRTDDLIAAALQQCCVLSAGMPMAASIILTFLPATAPEAIRHDYRVAIPDH